MTWNARGSSSPGSATCGYFSWSSSSVSCVKSSAASLDRRDAAKLRILSRSWRSVSSEGTVGLNVKIDHSMLW